MTQTWMIDGKSMTHSQVLEWKAKRDAIISAPVEPPAEEVKHDRSAEILAEKGYSQENSTEAEYNRLKALGWVRLNGEERKLYLMYKEQLGK